MKKILIVVAVMALVSMSAFAQTEQGKLVVSGASDLTFSSVKIQNEYDGEDIGDDFTVKSFNIKPALGYFVIDNLSVGLTFDYESQKVESNKDKSFMFGPMARYYFGSSNVKPYVHADILFGNIKSEGEDYEYKTNLSGWDLGGGVAIFLNDYVSVDLGLSYASVTRTDDDDDKFKSKATGIAFSGGFSIFF